MMIRRFTPILCGLFLWLTNSVGQSDEGTDFFEKKIRPVLVQHCYKCHGEKKQESDLRLDLYQEMLRGGATGPAVVPGNPRESLLLHTIGYEDEELQMPPDGKLPDQILADFRRWIEMDAPHPDANSTSVRPRQGKLDLEKERSFWSFQPVVQPPLAKVNAGHWPTRPLDYFVLSQLEQNKLSPAPPADRRILIRRATFDLTGLPPTATEIDTFLNDTTANAYERLIDRLLNSPRYGERWGRFWLDVVRYADSNGLDENVAHGNAWRYRDYVIAAFNQDTPFDKFLTEQIAGDLLPQTDSRALNNRRLIATGFLVLGPKVLAEVDEVKMEMDIIDEQINTIGQAFMGMTFGCARCHDHKFDPISTEDYYGLAGVFKSTSSMESFTKIARWNEYPVASDEEQKRYDTATDIIKQKTEQLDKLTAAANQSLLELLKTDKLPEMPENQYPPEVKTKYEQLQKDIAARTAERGELPSAMGVQDGEPIRLQVHLRGSPQSLGKQVERRFPEVFVSDNQHAIPADASGRMQFAQWLTNPQHPLTSRVIVNRIWRWHFGRGIQPTTDNFGKLGERPINQPLLDHLARAFMDNHWSIKDLHRWIMTSSTYRMSSDFDAASSQADPTNSRLWRFPVKRLEAEAIRDSVLAVSGMLDHSMGGSLLPVENRKFLFDHTSKDLTEYDAHVRSVYLPVVRNNLYDFFQLFDYNDASVSNGNRQSTTVAPQALYMMNSPLVDEASCQIVHQLLASNPSIQSQVQQLYLQLLGRPATREELTRARQYYTLFLKTADAETTMTTESASSPEFDALKLLVHSILSSNEFIYIR